jgi:methyl-accepting chemotaxis protein
MLPHTPNAQKVTFDFSQARFKHLTWKFRLRSFLDGKESMTPDQAVSHKHCDLGLWFYSEGKERYGHLPAVQAFEIKHELLHDTVKQIVELKLKGNSAAAEKAYKDLVKISDEIIELLNQAEAQITAAA